MFLEDKRFDLLVERQTAVIVLVYFPPRAMQYRLRNQTSAELSTNVFLKLGLHLDGCSFLPLFSVA